MIDTLAIVIIILEAGLAAFLSELIKRLPMFKGFTQTQIRGLASLAIVLITLIFGWGLFNGLSYMDHLYHLILVLAATSGFSNFIKTKPDGVITISTTEDKELYSLIMNYPLDNLKYKEEVIMLIQKDTHEEHRV